MAVSLPSLKAKTEQKDEIAFRWKHRPIGDFPKIRKLGPLILLGFFGDGPTQSSAWRYDGWRKMYIIKKVLYELKSEKCGRLFSPLHLNEYFVELRYMQQQQVMRLKFMLSISQNELSVIMTFRVLLQVLNWTLSRPFWHRNMLWLKPFPCSFLSSAPFTSPPASTMQFLVAYPQPDAVTTINHHGEGFGCIWPEYLPATVCGQLYGFLSKINFVFLGWKFTFMKEKCPKCWNGHWKSPKAWCYHHRHGNGVFSLILDSHQTITFDALESGLSWILFVLGRVKGAQYRISPPT